MNEILLALLNKHEYAIILLERTFCTIQIFKNLNAK